VEEVALAEYEMAKKMAKEAVAQVHQQERKTSGEKLNTEEEQRSVFRIAKQLPKERQNVGVGVICLRDESGSSRKATDKQEEMEGEYGAPVECIIRMRWNGRRWES